MAPILQTCSTGVMVEYFIYGGTPPYTVAATFPGAVTLLGVPVLTNGGSFTATTTGACFVNMQYAITDATGRTVPGGASPLLTNEVGKGAGSATTARSPSARHRTIPYPTRLHRSVVRVPGRRRNGSVQRCGGADGADADRHSQPGDHIARDVFRL